MIDCLNKYPLAALDPNYQGIQPGDTDQDQFMMDFSK